MRIRKAPTNGKQGVNGNGEFTAHELLLWGEIKEPMSSSSTREIVEQLYVKHVISPLLGPNHVDAGVCLNNSVLLCNFNCSCLLLVNGQL